MRLFAWVVQMRILVVEDDLRFRGVLAEFLKHDGFQLVGVASDGDQALRLFDRHHPDLILTDSDMPGCNGIELVRRLRKRGDRTPVVMLSGECESEAMARAIAAGVNRYLVKPVTAPLLTGVLRQTYLSTAA